ncbi:MAG: FG-GAP repeat protein, partial [Proteobacteria bacterium]|nr:FG-GAP repeat protein [Pseudomonadota bacterium]
MKQGQFPAILNLMDLNGKNGFKLDGEASGDSSGYSVSAAGDINGDGVSDLLIGAAHHASNTGRSYVVFGGPGVGSSGLISLSGLNGSNGFKLDGEAVNDFSGWSVNTAGDINGDGVSDLLVGAYYHASGTGRSYVVFGGPGVGSSGLI